MVGGCDDGNVCTNDVCNPGIGCVHTPVPGTCDDGVLCNGADSCGEGTCSVHDMVDPCPGSSFCDAASDECMGCEDAGDCPGEMIGDWGACVYPSDVCVRTGSRSRNVRSYMCSDSGTCEASDRVEIEACMRDTDGTSCGGTTTGDWSACTYANPMCGTSGTRTRTVTTRVCGAGTCQTRMIMESDMAGCARTTDGNTCNSPTPSPWGACGGFSDTCDETGTQSRTVTQPRCGGGTCSTSTMTIETQACMRETDGTSCGAAPTCTDWSTCRASSPSGSACTGTGVQTRLCSGSFCGDGSCAMSTRALESRSCLLGPRDAACVVSVTCGSECEGCPSSTGGYRECTATTGACNMGGNCMGSATATLYQACTCP
jgi:hypothetical protein